MSVFKRKISKLLYYKNFLRSSSVFMNISSRTLALSSLEESEKKDIVSDSKIFTIPTCYKLKILELIKRKNLVLGLIQENLIENSV